MAASRDGDTAGVSVVALYAANVKSYPGGIVMPGTKPIDWKPITVSKLHSEVMFFTCGAAHGLPCTHVIQFIAYCTPIDSSMPRRVRTCAVFVSTES